MGWRQQFCNDDPCPSKSRLGRGYCSSANCDRIADGRAGSGRRLDQRREVALLSGQAGILQCRTGAHNVADRQALRSLCGARWHARCRSTATSRGCLGRAVDRRAGCPERGDRPMAPDDPAVTNELGERATDSGPWICNFKLYQVMLCISGCITGVASRYSGGPWVPSWPAGSGYRCRLMTLGNNCSFAAQIYQHSRPGPSGYLLCDTKSPVCAMKPRQARRCHMVVGTASSSCPTGFAKPAPRSVSRVVSSQMAAN